MSIVNLSPHAHATEGSETGAARSLRRAIAILELLKERKSPVGAGEIISALGLPRSTAYEILRILVDAGFVRTTGEGGRYTLGQRLFEFGSHVLAEDPLLREGAKILGSLRDQTGETVQLSVLEGRHMRVLLKEEGKRAVRIISETGSRVPVNWAAAGRLLVSDLDDVNLRTLLSETVLPSPTGKAPVDVRLLISQIRQFRADGHATEFSETNDHAGCVAAPVVNANGKCIAAISLAAPESRLRSAEFGELAAAVMQAARRLSDVLNQS